MVNNRLNDSELKLLIKQNLARFSQNNPQAVTLFFEGLGYGTDLSQEMNRPEHLLEVLAAKSPRLDRLLLTAENRQWRSLDVFFQITDEQIKGQKGLFQSFDRNNFHSYIVIAVGLTGQDYKRSEFAQFTRELNRLSDIPILVLFRHGIYLTLAVIHRRPNLTDKTQDVLEKITLIKDINTRDPHRAQVEILADFAISSLQKNYQVRNFDDLHEAWLKVFDISILNKKFFAELSAWYFWAVESVKFPGAESSKEKNHQQISVIRLITRLIFIWFLKEKGIIDLELFEAESTKLLLRNFDSNDASSDYYRAILQNLFFATLNTERSAEKTGNRQFISDNLFNKLENEHQFFKYADYFQDRDKWLFLVKEIPFLNGGLFECLDQVNRRLDGFWDDETNPLQVPNFLFFGKEQTIDLSEVTGNKQLKKQKVRGIFEIFNGYKFTVNENTPVEQEVALDPELLGKVFENLLAEYNPETETTARKKTGSFYTPREIVDYMVDEALLAYLMSRLWSGNSPGLVKLGSNQVQLFGDDYTKDQLSLHESVKLSNYPGTEADLERDLRDLLAYNDRNPFIDLPDVRLQITRAIAEIRVLDPACGSGAFPMGILQKLVHLLNQVDPENLYWQDEQKEAEIAPLLADIEQAKRISYEAAREEAIAKLRERLAEIEAKFSRESQDYPRKLFLIERCIFGVDIQAIAVQIAKLRFFIALMVEQGVDENLPNRGIVPLPNLETKFVAANTLIGIATQQTLRNPEVFEKEKALREVRQQHFLAQTPMMKQQCRERDAQLRSEIGALLRATGLDGALVDTLASWNPYDQNASATFFDAEWMFGMNEGFDIVIGNPPYVRQEKIKEFKAIFQKQYQTYTSSSDVYVYFYEKAFDLLKDNGTLAYISSNKWFRANYGVPLRKYISQNANIKNIVDFGELSVFSAATFPMIFIAFKQKVKKQTPIFTQVKSLDPPYPDVQALTKQVGKALPSTAINSSEWLLNDSAISDILKKTNQNSTTLGAYVNNQIYLGIKTGFNKAFIIDAQKRDELIKQDPNSAEIIKPLAVGDDVRKWHIRESNKYLILTKIGVQIKKYQAIFQHLSQYQKELEKRYDKGKFWWELRACDYYQLFEQPKIIYPDIAKESRFALDTQNIYFGNTVYFISVNDLYLLGILNSRSSWFYCKENLTVLGDADKGGRLRFFRQFVEKIPIPNASKEQKQAIETLVGYVLYLTAELKNMSSVGQELIESADDKLMASYFEQIIDAAVMELYLPEELHAGDKYFMRYLLQENLPNIDKIKGNKIAELRIIFKRLFEREHPIRTNIYFLGNLDIVKTIRGKV